MSPARKTEPVDPTDQKLEEVVRLLAILVMRDRPLQDTIGEMSLLGFGPTRIAQLVGTSPDYAKVAANRAKQKRAKRMSRGGSK